MGCHSTMLSPDSVRRVTPPTTMTAKTSAEENKSQYETDGGVRTGSVSAEDASEEETASACERTWAALEEKNRGSNEGRWLSSPLVNDLR